MLKDLKNTLKQSIVYGISRFAAKSVSFILLPLYTSIFSSENIANINLLESLWQYIYVICLFAFETAIIAYCASEKDEKKVRSIIFTFFILLVFNSIITICAGLLASGTIAEYFLNDPNLIDVTTYCFIISAFESLLVIPLTIARLRMKPILYTVISVSSLGINLILQFYFLIYVNAQIDYVFLSKAISPFVLVMLLTAYIIKNTSPRFETRLLKSIYKFSLPLMVASLLALLLNTINRYILVDFVDKTQVAIFTLGYSVGSVTNFFIVSPFVLAFNVISWKKLNDSDANRFFTKTATYLFFVMIYMSLMISLFIPEVIRVFILNPELWEAVSVIRIILFSNCIAALYFISIQSYYFTKRTDLIFWTFTACLILNIVSNFLLVRYYGIIGSALLSVLSYTVLIMISYNAARKLYFIKFENYKIILLSILYILVVYLVSYFAIDYSILNLIFKLAIILVFPFILYPFRFYERIEIDSINKIIKKYNPIKIR